MVRHTQGFTLESMDRSRQHTRTHTHTHTHTATYTHTHTRTHTHTHTHTDPHTHTHTHTLTTVARLGMCLTEFSTSSSVTSMREQQLSSSGGRGSAPCRVTHGCT